jgi:hypothetical protein
MAVPSKFYELVDPQDTKIRAKINGSSKLPIYLEFSEVYDLKINY